MEPPLRHPASARSTQGDAGRVDVSSAADTADAGMWALALALLEPEPTFGVYDEGDGLLSLYATPFQPRTLARALDGLGGELLDVTPRWGVPRAVTVSLDALAKATSPLELVHVGSGGLVDGVPLDTVLAAPHATVAGDRLLAASLHEQHAVIYARDPAVIARILEVWLREQVGRQCSVEGAGPSILTTAMPSVLAPLPLGAFRRVELSEEPRYWFLDLTACVTDDLGDDVVIDPLRWVGGHDRPWRAGWSW